MNRPLAYALVGALLLVLSGWGQSLWADSDRLTEGIHAYQNGDFDRAIELLGIAVAHGFERPDELNQAHLYLGLSYIAYGRLSQADTVFSRIVRANPSFRLDPELFPRKAVARMDAVRGKLVSGITIHTVPPGVQVQLDGLDVGASDAVTGRLLLSDLLVGSYELVFSKLNFALHLAKVRVTAGPPEELHITLPRRMVSLLVNTEPAGAQISVNGTLVGTAPLEIEQPSGSSCQLRVSQDYHIPIEATVHVGDAVVRFGSMQIPVGQSAVLLPFTLHPVPPGSIRIASNPSNAEVYLDGTLQGKTPCAIPTVVAGPHELTIRLAGFDELVRSIEVRSDEEWNLDVALGALVRVFTHPPGCTVYLGAEQLGQAPVTIGPLPTGEHLLRASQPGYLPTAKLITIQNRDSQSERLLLFPLTGSLSVDSQPSGAQVVLDGQLRGQTPLLIHRLAIGHHSLELVKPGFSRWMRQQVIESREIAWVHVPLQPQLD